MKSRWKSHLSAGHWIVLLAAVLVIAGCSTIKLVADYDEQIDTGTTALQKAVETFIVKLESTAARPDDKVAPYEDKDKQFYLDAKVAISGLRLRADATERNSLTVRAFDKLGKNIDRLEEMHRSQEGLKRSELAKLIRPGLTQQFTAILTFELAKRRGEKPDESKSTAVPTPDTTDAGGKI